MEGNNNKNNKTFSLVFIKNILNTQPSITVLRKDLNKSFYSIHKYLTKTVILVLEDIKIYLKTYIEIREHYKSTQYNVIHLHGTAQFSIRSTLDRKPVFISPRSSMI